MKFRTFTGDTSTLTSKGRTELPETVMIRDAMEASATEGGKKIEFVDLTKAEIEKTKNRIPNIAGRFGYSYRMWDVPGGVVLSATFKKQDKEKAAAEPEPTPEVTKPKSGPRRSARKATTKTNA